MRPDGGLVHFDQTVDLGQAIDSVVEPADVHVRQDVAAPRGRIWFTKVLLPEPETPVTHTKPPSGKVASMPCKLFPRRS